MPNALLRTLAIAMVTTLSFAHADLILTLKPNGTLEGLPSNYGPTSLQVKFSENALINGPIESFQLVIGTKKVTIPKCIAAYLQTQKLDEITVSASWYHDPMLLPPYICINFNDPGSIRRDSYNPGYSFLFNLDTGKLIKLEIIVLRNGGNGCQYVPVDLAKLCKPNVLSTILDAPAP